MHLGLEADEAGQEVACAQAHKTSTERLDSVGEYYVAWVFDDYPPTIAGEDGRIVVRRYPNRDRIVTVALASDAIRPTLARVRHIGFIPEG